MQNEQYIPTNEEVNSTMLSNAYHESKVSRTEIAILKNEPVSVEEIEESIDLINGAIKVLDNKKTRVLKKHLNLLKKQRAEAEALGDHDELKELAKEEQEIKDELAKLKPTQEESNETPEESNETPVTQEPDTSSQEPAKPTQPVAKKKPAAKKAAKSTKK